MWLRNASNLRKCVDLTVCDMREENRSNRYSISTKWSVIGEKGIQSQSHLAMESGLSQLKNCIYHRYINYKTCLGHQPSYITNMDNACELTMWSRPGQADWVNYVLYCIVRLHCNVINEAALQNRIECFFCASGKRIHTCDCDCSHFLIYCVSLPLYTNLGDAHYPSVSKIRAAWLVLLWDSLTLCKVLG